MTDIKVMNKAIDQIFVIIFKCISCVHDLLKLFTLRATKWTSYFMNNIYVRARVLAIETDLCRNARCNERAFFRNYPNINLSKRASVDALGWERSFNKLSRQPVPPTCLAK